MHGFLFAAHSVSLSFWKTKIFVSLREECGGGKEWLHSNIILTNLVREASLFSSEDLPKCRRVSDTVDERN
jgi:hypothetical protein